MIDLSSQRENVMFKTSQSKTLEVVKKMLSNLKVKTETEGTSVRISALKSYCMMLCMLLCMTLCMT